MILKLGVKFSEIFIVKAIGKYTLVSHTLRIAFSYIMFFTCEAKCKVL